MRIKSRDIIEEWAPTGAIASEIIEYRGRTQAISNSRVGWTERAGLLLSIEDEQGYRGIGEASTLPGYSGETLEVTRAELSTIDWTHAERLVFASSAARFAVESALLDLAARRAGQPVARLLGVNHVRAPLAAMVSAGDEVGVIEQVRRAIARGIRTVKLKVGRRDFARELQLIAAIRHAFGAQVGLRLDANQAWTLEQAEVALRALERYGPEFVEEPVVARDWPALTSPVPLALDESLQVLSLDQIRNLAANGVVSALVLKPMALGGFTRCRELADLAVQFELPCVVTHLFDGPLALAASAELALSLPARLLACGLDRHPGLAAWPAWPVPQIGDAEVVTGSAIGFGVEVRQ